MRGIDVSDNYMRADLYSPSDFDKREFAVSKNGEMIRHLSFPAVAKLRAFLIEHAPHGVFFSSARYDYPDIVEMSEKKKHWLGSDLVFDIDNDHLTKQTLAEAKRQALKLVSILREDFGLQELMLVFSGQRGYHVHVHDACIQQLGNAERREIVDYFARYYPGTEKRDELGKVIPDSGKRNPNHVEIDAPVTADITRLIRLPGTLNVKATAGRCNIVSLDSVDMPIAPKARAEQRRHERVVARLTIRYDCVEGAVVYG